MTFPNQTKAADAAKNGTLFSFWPSVFTLLEAKDMKINCVIYGIEELDYTVLSVDCIAV
jgi:hypothetical protein